MFITHKKDLVLNGDNPTYLYAYGGFNVNIVPSFSTSLIPFLEEGGIVAIPNIRGGGDIFFALRARNMFKAHYVRPC